MSRIKTDAAPKSVITGTDTGLKIGCGTSYRQYLRYRFKALPADKGIQKISFIPSQTTSTMFFNGRSTVY
jgi:hypothetical protein